MKKNEIKFFINYLMEISFFNYFAIAQITPLSEDSDHLYEPNSTWRNWSEARF